MSKQVLFITTVYPYPKDDGKKIILSSMLEYYIFKYGIENVHIVLIGETERNIDSSLNIIKLKKPSFPRQIFNILTYSILFKSKSLQESVLYSNRIKNKLKELISHTKYEKVIFDTIRTAQYFLNEPPMINEIVYLDDLFSVRYQKMLETMERYPNVELNPLGNFKKHLPSSFSHIVKVGFLTKILLRREMKLVRKSELNVSKRYNNCLLISKQEIEFLNKNYGLTNIKQIKPLLDRKEYERNLDVNDRVFIFLGNLSIAHNNVSIVNFIEKNIENMIKHNLKLKVIGKNPSERLLKLESKYRSNINVVGYVENLNEEFSKAYGMIIPLLFGSGVKIKTLEAFSIGLPIITTDYGIEGINFKDEELNSICIVENEISNFWVKMLQICNIELNNSISISSYKFFESNYTKEPVYSEYEGLLTSN
ncbi:glycosyltransferase [Heyndrickxia coagulans]|uniref:glycosyltransferase n=1 Tax=Heyndrickxia coagulans TaxID=1398 RepID=UPI000E47E345|nr:glycosyltransferase [Heyndrickxia coagulans]RGR83287.1 glycosyltransferase [Heyndrickxia coagulans]